MCLGFDPGTTNLGIAVIEPEVNSHATLFQIKLVRRKDAIERMRGIQYLMWDCINWLSYKYKAVIEGASFGNPYRQVELAEVRATIALWCLDRGESMIIPPNTIRKAVFGNGKIKAHEVWENLPPDAAAALSCAYYAVEN
jgi:Holliday junction resolvasome RuvABC endonuclease subunit